MQIQLSEMKNFLAQLREVKSFLDRIMADKDILYIIQNSSIGDLLYIGGLFHVVQKRKNKKATVLILNERMKNLGITYENLVGIIYLPGNILDVIMRYYWATEDWEGDNYIYGHWHDWGMGLWTESNLNAIDRYKKSVLDIPLDSEFLPPIVPPISAENIAELHRKYFLDKSRTIILLPHTHTLNLSVGNFWEVMAAQLKARGYIVYTNTDGMAEKPIAGTEAITTSFRELYYISDKVKCFIGTRNGVFDFLAMTKARILNINTFAKWWVCDLSIMFPGCNSRTFYDAVEYVKPIANYLQQEKVGAQIRLSHEKINSEDIFYSYEDILNAILAEVNKN